MMIKIITLIFALTLGVSTTLMARPYVGASGGISTVDTSGYQVGFTQKIYTGLRHQDSGLELAFINLGDFNANDGSATIRVTGVAVSVMPYFPITQKFELFGKFGGFAWNSTNPTGNITFLNSDGFSYTVGIGANLNIFRHFTLRLEVQKFYQIGATSSGAGGSGTSTATAGAVFVF